MTKLYEDCLNYMIDNSEECRRMFLEYHKKQAEKHREFADSVRDRMKEKDLKI